LNVLIVNINAVYGTSDKPLPFKRGAAMSVLESVSKAFIRIENGIIAEVGSMKDLDTHADVTINAENGMVLPSWCDSHTHIVYAGTREQEFIFRIKGMSYEEIAARGGGILNSAERMQNVDEDQLYEQSLLRLNEVMRMGTGAIEIKSGYGLSYESELKMLRVIRRLKEQSLIPIKATFLGAHAIPKIYQSDRQGYMTLLTEKMLPKIVDEGLADYIDVFCDKGYFTVDETDTILEYGSKYGLKAKIHANELANSGGVQIGVKHNALSVDHLEMIEEKEVQALLASETIPTVLPSCSFYLNIKYAPARMMIDSGLGIAMATDYNPGSTPSGNIPFLINLACNKMKLMPEEAINAITINGAYAMEMNQELGSIEVGKVANLIITKPMGSLAFIPYAFGSNHIHKVIVRGKEI